MSPHVDDVGVSSSLVRSSHVSVLHTCIACRNIFLGPIGDLFEYQFVFEEDTLDVHTETTHPNIREGWHEETWHPTMSVRVYIFFLRHM